MKVIVTFLLLYAFGLSNCTYNNINKFVGETGDNLFLLGQYGTNKSKPCEFNTVIKSKHIESFAYSNSNSKKVIIITMVSGDKHFLTATATSFNQLVKLFKKNM